MNSRIRNVVWRLYAHIGAGQNNSICNGEKAVYLNIQGSSYRISMTQRLAASLEKAKADQELIRSFVRISSFISPLLGPLCYYTRVFFYAKIQPVLNFSRCQNV